MHSELTRLTFQSDGTLLRQEFRLELSYIQSTITPKLIQTSSANKVLLVPVLSGSGALVSPDLE